MDSAAEQLSSNLPQTGKMRANWDAHTARTISHTPTRIKIAPPQRLAERVLPFIDLITLSCARLTAVTKMTITIATVNAAMRNAENAVLLFATASACKAKPAKMGPVQPKPAST